MEFFRTKIYTIIFMAPLGKVKIFSWPPLCFQKIFVAPLLPLKNFRGPPNFLRPLPGDTFWPVPKYYQKFSMHCFKQFSALSNNYKYLYLLCRSTNRKEDDIFGVSVLPFSVLFDFYWLYHILIGVPVH